MSDLTINQHHVWQYHIKAWSNENDQIWCLQQGKSAPYLTHTRNVASQRLFYEFHELTEADEAYLEWVVTRSNDERLRELNRGWVNTMQMSFRLRNQLSALGMSDPNRQKLEQELVKIEKTLGERYHGDMENQGKPMLDALRFGDASFYQDNDQKRMTFIMFLSWQYFRTAKIRHGVLTIPLELPYSPERTWPIEAFIYATNLSVSLFTHWCEYHIVILENRSDRPFITGDQPIINLLGLNEPKVELFYPLSPTHAIIFTSNTEQFSSDCKVVGSIEVESYNFQIYQQSDTQIYGSDQDYLATFKGMPKGSLAA